MSAGAPDRGGINLLAIWGARIYLTGFDRIPLCSVENGATRRHGGAPTRRNGTQNIQSFDRLRTSIQRPMSNDQVRATTTATTDICIRRGDHKVVEDSSENRAAVRALVRRLPFRPELRERGQKDYGVEQLRNLSSSVKTGLDLPAKAWLAFAGLHTREPGAPRATKPSS